jgi:hypothetical protein
VDPDPVTDPKLLAGPDPDTDQGKIMPDPDMLGSVSEMNLK